MSLSDKELTELLIDTYGFKEAYSQGEIDAVLDSQQWEPPHPILKEAVQNHYRELRIDNRNIQRQSIFNGLLWGCGFILAIPFTLFCLIVLGLILRISGHE